MPEFDKQQVQGRKQLDQRDFFNFTAPNLKVTAHGTDPYIKQYEDLNVASFVDTMKNITNGTSAYINLQAAQKEENVLKAKADQAQGKYDKPDTILNQGVGYSTAWKVTDGEHRMGLVSDAHLADAEKNNGWINSPDPEKARMENFQQHYQSQFGSMDPNDTATFAGASHLYEATLRKSASIYQKEFNKQSVNTHTQQVADNAGRLLDFVVSQGGTAADLREAWGSLRHTVDPNIIPPAKLGTVVIQAAISKIEQKMMDEKVPLSERDAYAEHALAALELGDKDGVVWGKQVAEDGSFKNRNLIDAARTSIHNLSTHLEEKARIKQERAYKDNAEGILAALGETQGDAKLKSFLPLIDQARQEGYISSEWQAHLQQFIQARRNSYDWLTEDPKQVATLRQNAIMGKLTVGQLLPYVGTSIKPHTLYAIQDEVNKVTARKAELAALNDQGAKFFQVEYTGNQESLSKIYSQGDGLDKETDRETLAAALDLYRDNVFNRKMSPTAAAVDVRKTYPLGGAVNAGGFANEEEAKAWYRTVLHGYNSGEVSRSVLDEAQRRVRPWMLRAKWSEQAQPVAQTTMGKVSPRPRVAGSAQR